MNAKQAITMFLMWVLTIVFTALTFIVKNAGLVPVVTGDLCVLVGFLCTMYYFDEIK